MSFENPKNPMRAYLLAAVTGLIVLASPASSRADEGHAAACPSTVDLPAELAGWNTREPLKAGKSADKLDNATLGIGTAVDAALLGTPDVKYASRPEKPGGSVSYGGLFAFTAQEAGRFRVALGSGAWIDVVRDGETVESVAHGHGPECSGVRKMVDFDLAPGTYTLQIAANGQPDLALLVTRLP